MRILLVHPEACTGPVGFRLGAMPEPLGLEILAASVGDHEAEILDLRMEDDLSGALSRFSPDVVAVTALTTEVYAAQEVMRDAKAHSKEIFTVVGGHHATLIPADFYLPYVDAVCLGEGELVFPRLIDALATARSAGTPRALKQVPNMAWRDPDGEFVDNGRTPERTDPDAIPLPRRDLIRKYQQEYCWILQKPVGSMSTSRGCPYRCNFCSVWQFYGGQACWMSPDRVMDEIAALTTHRVVFADDNFLLNYRREMEVAKRILAEGIDHKYTIQCRTDSIVRHPDLVEKWVEAGLYAVFLGLEGASDKMLQEVNKKNTAETNDEAIRILQSNGVLIWAAFIVHPDWEVDDFKQLKDYVAEKDFTHRQFTVITPLPGTQLYRDRYADLLTHDYRCYDNLHSVLPTRLPREEFYRQLADLYKYTKFGSLYDLVANGTYEVADLRRGYEMIKKMSSWELYLENDPVLGRRDRTGNVGADVGVTSG